MGKYDFNEVIDRKNTYCTQWDYIEDRFGEHDLLPFSISDTEFQVPTPVLEAIQARVAHGVFGYSRWNHDAFKGSITNWYQTRFNAHVDKDWVLYSPTVCYAISVLIRLKSEEWDRVVVFSPMYDAFYSLIEENNRELVENELVWDNGKYCIDFERLEKQLKGAKILLLTNPHNPTGRVFDKAELAKVIEICERHHIFIISDDIHMDIVYGNAQYTPILSLAENPVNMCICTSASKTMNTPGLIGSYLLVPDATLRAAFLKQLKARDALSSVSILGMYATMASYNESADYVDELVIHLENNMHFLKNYITNHIPEIRFEIPEGTYLAWLDVSALGVTKDALQEALIHVGKVAIMPGETYGGPGFLRMNVACSRSKLVDGLERMNQAIQTLRR
ncbi:aminotransferase class I and II family protein [Listeria weihenstephanensis FSL R9-0317]|uniref:cysteine-S-conjugate beta-lyase n=1 Tax=Listeria weihenstephanensis TaxID=1006155 RepID=A0A1S7FXF5_9LIST|nr:MalY/PatB family protein [Listeria weihenstephanensis]AQY52111.1 beta-cystathionase [Listeria weihenstephanensis]EUJ37682.1 aminotransferase class I and II family protein [Listeria weihenstephanensis FSL R9-0317]